MKGDEQAMKHKKNLIFNFFLKFKCNYLLEKLHHVVFKNKYVFQISVKIEKQTVNMPRQYFDIREDEQLFIKIRKYPCLFNKIGSDMHG